MSLNPQRTSPRLWPGLLALLASGGVGADALSVELFVAAADRGQCIETEVYRLIRERGPDDAAAVVQAALEAHAQRAKQQRLLGCAGDIAAQAIAAGADPDQVLQATAAGL